MNEEGPHSDPCTPFVLRYSTYQGVNRVNMKDHEGAQNWNSYKHPTEGLDGWLLRGIAPIDEVISSFLENFDLMFGPS